MQIFLKKVYFRADPFHDLKIKAVRCARINEFGQVNPSLDPYHVYWNSGGGGYFLVKGKCMGMCRWMGSHFHNWVDYNELHFLVELLEWDRTV